MKPCACRLPELHEVEPNTVVRCDCGRYWKKGNFFPLSLYYQWYRLTWPFTIAVWRRWRDRRCSA